MSLRIFIFFFIAACALVAGIIRFRVLSNPDKIIASLLGLSAFTELVAYISQKIWHNNLIVYHIFSPFELMLTSLYFHQTVAALRRTRIALITTVLAVPLAIVNACYLQNPTTVPNSYFVLLEGTLIIIYALLSFYQLLMEEEQLPFRFAQFWISASLIVFWSFTYTGWGIYSVLNVKGYPLAPLFQNILMVACYLQYVGITFTFVQYKKLSPSGA